MHRKEKERGGAKTFATHDQRQKPFWSAFWKWNFFERKSFLSLSLFLSLYIYLFLFLSLYISLSLSLSFSLYLSISFFFTLEVCDRWELNRGNYFQSKAQKCDYNLITGTFSSWFVKNIHINKILFNKLLKMLTRFNIYFS